MKINMSKNIRQVKLVHSVSQYVEIHCLLLIDLLLSDMFIFYLYLLF